jgi:hypothetical protein
MLFAFDEPGVEQSEATRMGMHARWRKVYNLAIEFFLDDAQDAISAFEWSERWRGRAFAVMLGNGKVAAPEGVPDDWLRREREAIAALMNARTYVCALAARQELDLAWALLRTSPAAVSYVALRSGSAITFEELRALLASEEGLQYQSPMSTNGAQ